MAMELEDRLNLHNFKEYEIADAVAVLNNLVSKGKFTNDNPESRYRFCLKVIENARQKPQAKADDFNLHVAENLFEHLEEKHGKQWMKDKFDEVQKLKETRPSLYSDIEAQAKVSYVYHKHLVSKKCKLDPSERVELEMMCVEIGTEIGKKIELTEARQRISDKVKQQMEAIENKALAKAIVCVYVCNYMDKKIVKIDDDIEF